MHPKTGEPLLFISVSVINRKKEEIFYWFLTNKFVNASFTIPVYKDIERGVTNPDSQINLPFYAVKTYDATCFINFTGRFRNLFGILFFFK